MTGSVTNRSDETRTSPHAFASSADDEPPRELEEPPRPRATRTSSTTSSPRPTTPSTSSRRATRPVLLRRPALRGDPTSPSPASTGSACTPSDSTGRRGRLRRRPRPRSSRSSRTPGSRHRPGAAGPPAMVSHAPDGSLRRRPLGGALAPGGSLGALVELGTAAGSRPVSWLVDRRSSTACAGSQRAASALPRARPTRGGRRRRPERRRRVVPRPVAGPSPSAGTGDDAEPSPRADCARPEAAQSWLDRLRAWRQRILTLPYGDVGA